MLNQHGMMFHASWDNAVLVLVWKPQARLTI